MIYLNPETDKEAYISLNTKGKIYEIPSGLVVISQANRFEKYYPKVGDAPHMSLEDVKVLVKNYFKNQKQEIKEYLLQYSSILNTLQTVTIEDLHKYGNTEKLSKRSLNKILEQFKETA